MSEKSTPKKQLEAVASAKAVNPTSDEVMTFGAWLRQVANNSETSGSVRSQASLLARDLEASTNSQAQRNELVQRAAAFARMASE